jgi:hypothetical protein
MTDACAEGTRLRCLEKVVHGEFHAQRLRSSRGPS